MKKGVTKRIAAIILSAVLCVGVFGSTRYEPINAAADTISDLEKKLAANSDKIKDTKKELEKTKDKKEQEIQFQATLTEQINLLTDNILMHNDMIEQLEIDIEVKTAEIADKESEVSDSIELFKKRLRAMYIAGSGNGYASIIMGATDFFDLLAKMEMVKRVAEHDNRLIDELEDKIVGLNEDKAELEDNLFKLSNAKADLEIEMADLYASYEQSQQIIDMYNAEAAAYAADIKKMEKKEEKIEAAIKQAILEKQRKEVQYVGGTFTWPVPGYPYISDGYGWRDLYGVKNFHKGTDITGSGVHGANIVAANDGEVITAKNTYTPGYSYGKYVVIDHGGGISTLYGHCSEVLVSVGQKVKKGDVIAKVGNTGNSYGAHLHFEVRINGNHTDPMQYFTKVGG